MARLTGKVALVSGGARGLGAAQVRRLHADGAKVAITDVRDDRGRQLAAELGDAAAYLHHDVTDAQRWRAVVAEIADTLGPINVLVNNAGIGAPVPFLDTTLDFWQQTMDVNLTGVFHGMQAGIESMLGSGGGSIINISSVAGLRGSAHLHPYVASKFAVRGLTKSVALEFGKRGIRVNSVHPGFIVTELTEQLGTPPDVALGRPGQPDDVADVVAFLASDESRYCTGAEFVVDGGMSAGPVPRS